MTVSALRLAPFLLAAALAATGCQPASDGTPPADAGTGPAGATRISGAGASFVYPLMSRWSADYNAATGHQVNYQSIGSSGGIAQVTQGTADFASSDKPLSAAELAEAGLGQFPSAIGGVVPVVNLQGLAPGELRLTGPLLADIFLGKVRAWDDPALVALNPGVALPASPISVVHRSDGSGTSFNFTNYLSKASADWKAQVGEGTSVAWPLGVGGKGNEGVASYVQQIDGSIGYVELAYALQNAMPYASMQNADGRFVEPGAESFAAAARTADWTSASEFDLVITNAPGPDAWPIAATNFILVPKAADPARTRATLDFFRWAFASGTEQASELHYVPLPPELVAQVEAYWASGFGYE